MQPLEILKGSAGVLRKDIPTATVVIMCMQHTVLAVFPQNILILKACLSGNSKMIWTYDQAETTYFWSKVIINTSHLML